jgi:hypothetical protein
VFRSNGSFYSSRIGGFRGETRFVQKTFSSRSQFEKENIEEIVLLKDKKNALKTANSITEK